MPCVLGTDEAGYGPNLGPLVIAGTVWVVPPGLGPDECCGRLATILTRQGDGAARPGLRRMVLADSKVVYRAGQGLEDLERGVLATLGAIGHWPASARAAWRVLAPQSAPRLRSIPWYRDDFPLPLAAGRADIEQAAVELRAALAEVGIELASIQARAVFEQEFNRWCAVCGSKSTVLSEATLLLVRKLLRHRSGGPSWILCDKHGGRNRYAALLGRFFPGQFIQVQAERRDESRYRLARDGALTEFRFASHAERYVPVALASMVAKYLRELAMHALNRFWQSQVPGLRPTAGYPVDAQRFRREIAPAQQALGIAEGVLWRYR